MAALGMAIAFLEEALIAEKTIKPGQFVRYLPESQDQLEYMVLDSQSLQHLEIIESASGTKEGSLFHFVDHCKTAFGKRQLKRWLMAPLMNIAKIRERQDAVADLTQLQFETDCVRAKLGKLPDVEKLLAKVFTYSIKHRVKAIYFEDVSLNKMKEFRTLLKTFRQTEEILRPLIQKSEGFSSKRLRQLLSFDDEGGMLPINLKQELAQFEKLIVWKKV